MTLMMLLDPVLLLAALAYSTRVYGWWRSLLVLGAATMWVGSHRLFGGKFLQYDWLAARWVAFACVKRERWVTAGCLIAFATSVRIFPGVFMLGPLLQALMAFVKERRISQHLQALLGAGAAALIFLVAASGATSGRGLADWGEFVVAIEQHN